MRRFLKELNEGRVFGVLCFVFSLATTLRQRGSYSAGLCVCSKNYKWREPLERQQRPYGLTFRGTTDPSGETILLLIATSNNISGSLCNCREYLSLGKGRCFWELSIDLITQSPGYQLDQVPVDELLCHTKTARWGESWNHQLRLAGDHTCSSHVAANLSTLLCQVESHFREPLKKGSQGCWKAGF